MIVLDTNVVSELFLPEPNPRVRAWLDSQFHPLYLTAISVGELTAGLNQMPAGRRRSEVADRCARLLAEFTGRVLPFDHESAHEYGRIRAERTTTGRPVSVPDVQIAAIALQHGAPVATRDAYGFEHEGLTVIDPWGD